MARHRIISSAACRVAYRRLLAGALLLVDYLAACVEDPGRPSGLMRSLDCSEQLGVDRLDRVAIDGLNCSLHLRLVDLFEHVER